MTSSRSSACASLTLALAAHLKTQHTQGGKKTFSRTCANSCTCFAVIACNELTTTTMNEGQNVTARERRAASDARVRDVDGAEWALEKRERDARACNADRRRRQTIVRRATKRTWPAGSDLFANALKVKHVPARRRQRRDAADPRNMPAVELDGRSGRERLDVADRTKVFAARRAVARVVGRRTAQTRHARQLVAEAAALSRRRRVSQHDRRRRRDCKAQHRMSAGEDLDARRLRRGRPSKRQTLSPAPSTFFLTSHSLEPHTSRNASCLDCERDERAAEYTTPTTIDLARALQRLIAEPAVRLRGDRLRATTMKRRRDARAQRRAPPGAARTSGRDGTARRDTRRRTRSDTRGSGSDACRDAQSPRATAVGLRRPLARKSKNRG